MNADGTNQRRVTFNTGDDEHPSWKPELPRGDTLTIRTRSGTLQVHNFYRTGKDARLGQGVSVAENEEYAIYYNEGDYSFAIGLTKQPLQHARDAAESQLIRSLGVSRSAACNLRLTLGVPNNVDPEKSGVDYGLSFCPGGKPL